MHIGFRYHIASLVSVFLSLFLGILVGGILFQDNFLIIEQDNIITELETRFAELESLIGTLQSREQLVVMGWDQIRNIFIEQALSGHDLIFYKNDDSQNLKRLISLVEEAGANVRGSFNWPRNYDQFQTQVDSVKPDPEQKTTVIIWAEEPFPEVALSGIDYFRELGWKISFLQPFLSNLSSLALLDMAERALVVNTADTFVGELALIQGLSRDLTGIYGFKNHAINLLPGVESDND